MAFFNYSRKFMITNKQLLVIFLMCLIYGTANAWHTRWHRQPIHPPVVVDPNQVGFVGCSMTMGIMNGLINHGSTLGWQPAPDYGGGGVYQWAKSMQSGYWTEFKNALAKQPAKRILWQLCSLDSTKSQETYENALKIADNIRALIPDVELYVSAQPSYNPTSHVCSIAGFTGPSRMSELAAELVANGVAIDGPVFGPLDYPSETLNDGCHPNTSGENLFADQFLNYFE